MNIRLYKDFTKRKNSTKQPPSTMTYVQRDVKTKENTSIENPVFIVTGFDPTINYVYVPLWNRYYFIDDVVIGTKGISELHCSCDALASYKAQIGAYNCFVERTTDSTKYDIELFDACISSKEKVSHSSQASTAVLGSGGVVVCRILNSSYGITTYIGAMSNFDHLFNPLEDDPSIQEAIQSILQYYMFNPANYIIDCYFLAVPFGQIPDKTPDLIECGWGAGQGGAYRYTGTTGTISGEVTLNKPTRYYNDFREGAGAFSQYYIYIPAVGEVSLSPDLIDTTLSLAYAVNIYTGEVAYRLYSTATTKSLVATYHGCLKAPLMTGSVMPNAGSVITSAIGGVGSALSGNPIAMGFSALNVVQNMISPTPSVNGSQGSCAGIISEPNVIITEVAKESGDSPNTVGKPCCKNLQLNTISGYIQCAGASLSVKGFGGEKDAINSFLNGGFYYE